MFFILTFISSLISSIVLCSQSSMSKFTISFPGYISASIPKLIVLAFKNFPNTIFPFKSSATFMTYAPALQTICSILGLSFSGYLSKNLSIFYTLIYTLARIIPYDGGDQDANIILRRLETVFAPG